MEQVKILDKLAVVTAMLEIWTGQTSLAKGDISLKEEMPDTLVKLGTKYLINPENLKQFNSIRGKVRRYLLKIGLPFLGGYAVPLDKLDDVCQTLADFKTEFDLEKQEFCAEYDNHVRDWHRANTEHESILFQLPLERVKKKLNFTYFGVKVAATSATEKNLVQHTAELQDVLIDEVVEACASFATTFLAGKDELPVRTAKKFEALADKLASLAFLGGNISPLERYVRDCGKTIEQNSGKKLTGYGFSEVVSIVSILSSKELLNKLLLGEIQANHFVTMPISSSLVTENGCFLKQVTKSNTEIVANSVEGVQQVLFNW